MEQTLLDKYARPVPRYTSYPTAPHFDTQIGPRDYKAWLRALPAETPLSLYLHIPFCDTLCWFCGCHTKIVARYEPVQKFLKTLYAELDLMTDALGGRGRPVQHIHWGGGSPTMLQAGDIASLGNALKERFEILDTAEFAVETDPRDLDEAKLDALAQAGVTRASIGVQDANVEVQKAINRIQPQEVTRACIDALRARGIDDINIDLIYGLPHQTVQRVRDTVKEAVAYNPSRLALFGYAHVPWMKTHQKMIEDTALPGPEERLESAETASSDLKAAGYVEIGLDHFARPDDSMAVALSDGTLNRNFQGYTTDTAPALVGLGPSAIGFLPQGYVQNHLPFADYRRSVEAGDLPVAKGIALDPDDKARRDVINDLMCTGRTDAGRAAERYGLDPRRFAEAFQGLSPMRDDKLVETDGWSIAITETGKPFRRTVCAAFDAYLANGKGRHSAAV